MSIAARHQQGSFEKSVIPDAYTSKACKMFIESLGGKTEPQVLDIGPVCGENINFFARRARRLFVCDQFSRLHQHRIENSEKGKTWEELDYPSHSFDGILMWDLVDRLDHDEAVNLIHQCCTLLRPQGVLLVMAYARQTLLPDVHTFVVAREYQVSFRPQQHLKLHVRCRHNRELMTMFSPLSLVKGQLNQNGFREFVFALK